MQIRNPILAAPILVILISAAPIHPRPISAHLVGQNVWHIPDETIWRRVQECGLGSIRIGGIEYNNNMPSRTTLLGWVRRIKAMGAEPIMQMPRRWSPEQAADLVRFFNQQEGARITYWVIGNEPNLRAEVPVAAVADYYRRLAPAMRDADPTIRIYGPECAWFDRAYYGPLIGGSLDITGKDSKGRFLIDGVTFHKYPFGNNGSRQAVLANAASGLANDIAGLHSLMAAAEAKHGRTGESKLGWGLTEFNISYNNPQPNSVDGHGVHSFLNGQFFAEVYGLGMQHGATFINTWSMFESGGSRNGTDLGFLDGGARVPRSSYHHMSLLARHFKGNHLASTSNLSDVRVLASRSESGIAVMILNMESGSSRNYALRLDLGAMASSEPLRVQVDGGVAMQHAGVIPAQTTMVLVFTPTGVLARTLRYGVEEARQAREPQERIIVTSLNPRLSAPRIVDGMNSSAFWADPDWNLHKADGRMEVSPGLDVSPPRGTTATGVYFLKPEQRQDGYSGNAVLLRNGAARRPSR